MGLSHEHVGPKILAKIQNYILARSELLFTICSEIPCRTQVNEIAMLNSNLF
jgi:hypothetical protein